MSLQTEYEFRLPKGYVDGEGNLHRTGVMRLATARDELEPLRDPRVGQNEAYLAVAILARVVTELGTLTEVSVRTIEGLFAADLAYLQDLYGIVNFGDAEMLAALGQEAPGAPEPPEPPPTAGSTPSSPPVPTSNGGDERGRRGSRPRTPVTSRAR